MNTTIAIVGAGGHVGRHAAAVSEAEGLTVHGVGRGDDLAAAVTDVDAVIHLAGTLQAIHGNTYAEANVETVRRTIAAARAAGVRRIVFLSYVGADPAARNAYLRTKGEAEELLRDSGLEVVLLRSAFVFGDRDDPGPSIAAFVQTDGKPVLVVGSGRQRYQPVYVGDVAQALVAAASGDVPAGTYSLAGPEVILVDEMVALLNGPAAEERHLEGLVARAAALVAPTLTQAMVGVLSRDSLPDVPLLWPLIDLTPTAMTSVLARLPQEVA